MKKILLSALTACSISISAFAQPCNPANHNSGLPTHPDSLWIFPRYLDCVEQGVAYEDVLYIKFPASGTVGLIPYTVNSVTLNQTNLSAGLPGGLVVEADQSSFSWAGGVIGCVKVSGTTLSPVGEYIPDLDIILNVTALGQTFDEDTSFTGQLSLTVITAGANCNVSVNDVYANANVNIYPQPASEELFFEISNENLRGNLNIEISNILGEVVVRNTSYVVNTSKTRIDVSLLPAGNYFFRASVEGNNISTGKLLIAK